MQSLAIFMHVDPKRLVVMGPDTNVYQAVRALEANHVGCVVIAEEKRIVGIVTDRDLALRILGDESEPRGLTLRKVMTAEVVSVPSSATLADAAKAMLEHRVRRVPIEAQGKLVGLVTLDDLVIRGFEPDLVARIVAAQLAEPAPRKENEDLHPMAPTHMRAGAAAHSEHRHVAHAEATYEALLRRVMSETELATKERAEIALEVLVGALVERIRPEQAADLVAQLPVKLRERLHNAPRGPNRMVTRDAIERVLGARLEIGDAEATELLVRLGRVVEHSVSQGEIRDVKTQLPESLRAIFS
jgi:CBS domain-containing protein/uncharacterized protein (DUF2267 family)